MSQSINDGITVGTCLRHVLLAINEMPGHTKGMSRHLAEVCEALALASDTDYPPYPKRHNHLLQIRHGTLPGTFVPSPPKAFLTRKDGATQAHNRAEATGHDRAAHIRPCIQKQPVYQGSSWILMHFFGRQFPECPRNTKCFTLILSEKHKIQSIDQLQKARHIYRKINQFAIVAKVFCIEHFSR